MPESVAVRATALALGMVATAAALAAGALALLLDDDPAAEVDRVAIVAAGSAGREGRDPFGWDPRREADFERRAAAGNSHVLYARSPGGVLASAARTSRWRDRIEAAAAASGVDADLLEAIVFLESAGRPEVSAGPTPEAASGLAQIIPSTATGLLGMRVDLTQSVRLTGEIGRARRRGDRRRAQRLLAQRARVDERFDPGRALAAAGRYLAIAEQRFGQSDLAVESYHMGIGNLERVIRAYVEPADASGPVGELVRREGLSYAEIYFNTSPLVNPRTHELLSGFGDESADYYWKVLGSRVIMRLWREDRARLVRIAELQTAKATAEEVFHPEDQTEVFEEPDEIERALLEGDLVPVPLRGRGFRVHRRLGELAPELDREPALYRALRPEALATLLYISARVREIGGARRPLIVTSAVRDRSYQELLIAVNPQATPEYSLHTTGFAFDIRREYENDAQGRAFQFVLDRLRALAVLDYAPEPGAIHVTVSGLGAELVG